MTVAELAGSITRPNSVSSPGFEVKSDYPSGNPTWRQVEVTETTPFTFKFTAKPHHHLQGSVVHGVFRDKSGEVWLFEEGTGVPAEAGWRKEVNAWIAWELWPQMGKRVKHYVIESGPHKN
jgi:hypothetical protein